MARARVKPNVHDVLIFAEMTAAAFRADGKISYQFFRCHSPPAVTAISAYLISNTANTVPSQNHLAAIFTVECGYRHPPSSLTADAPIGTILHHVGNTIFTPIGNPLYFVNALQRFFPKVSYGYKPLFSGTENNRLFAAPAMRI